MSNPAPQSASLRSRIIGQFGNPRGILGRLVGLVLANRPSNAKRNRWTVEQLGLAPGDRVLEIGCGPGVALQLCLKTSPDISCVGLDHSPVMIEMARSRNREAASSGRLHLVIGGTERLGFAGRGFNKAMMINVAAFVSDRAAMFATLKKMLDSPGRIIVTHQPRLPGARDADGEAFATKVAAELQAAGFSNVRIASLPLKPVAAQGVIGEM